MSTLRSDSVKNRAGTGSPHFPNGLTGVAATFTGAVSGASYSGGAISGTTGTFSGAVSGTTGTYTGNVSVGGVLTYEDVTNVDSVGLVTARGGIEIGAAGVGGTITSAGAAEFVGIVTAKEYEVVNAGNTPVFKFRGASNNEIGKIDADAISGTTSQLRLYTEDSGNIGERIRIGPVGQFGIGGATYGSSGQVLTSGGASAAPTWATPSAGPEVFSDSTNSVGTIANGGTIKEWRITPTKAWTRAIFGWSGCYRAQSNGHVYIDVKGRVGGSGTWGNIHTCGANTPAGSGSHNWNQGFTVTGELHADGTRLTGAANTAVDILLTCSSSMSIDHANDTGHDHNYWVMFFE
tara:strand:+ start:2098 stop:3144 length:1047 start_codon:yes stop_codon:yes gene_type:complete